MLMDNSRGNIDALMVRAYNLAMSTDAKRGKWYGAWCAYFTALLEERGLNPSSFAVLVDDLQNNIWNYEHGVSRPKLEKLDRWSRKLKLDEAEHAKFIRLARWAHLRPELRQEMEEMRRRIEELERRLRALTS